MAHISSIASSIVGDKIATVDTKEKSLTAYAIGLSILGIMFYGYEYYLRVAPSVMSNELKTAFSLNDAAFGMLAACYYYAYTPMQIPVGMMLDRWGVKRMMAIACFSCAVGTYLFTAATSLYIAQMGRFLIGFGSAFAYVGVLKISNIWLPKKYFALMAGIATAVGMAGGMTGELVMAYWVNKIGWQSTLNSSVIIGLILTVLLWIFLRDHQSKPQSEIQSKPDISMIQGFMLMTRNPQLWITGIIGCLLFLPISVFAELWAVPFLQTVGFSKSEAAMGSSMGFLGFAIGGPCWGLLSSRWRSRRRPLIMGSLLSALFMYAVIQYPSTSTLGMYSLIFIASVCASAQILIFAVSDDLTQDALNATAVSFTNMLVMLGGIVLPPFIGYLLDCSAQGGSAGILHSNHDFSIALGLIPIGLLISGVFSMFLKESYRHDDSM